MSPHHGQWRGNFESESKTMSMEDVEPVNPIAPYIGGKRILSKTLIPIINDTDHAQYAEPFIGMGGVFLRRDKKPKSEVINDINEELVTLFKVVQRYYPYFKNELKFRLTTRSDFERLKRTDPSTLLDFERAARFLYLQRTAFGGKVNGQNFGVSYERPARFNVLELIPYLEALYERLSGVIIECLHYGAFIKKYDRPATLFFLDPPYWNCETDYGHDVFSKDDHSILHSHLATIKGKFILTINDVPEIRALYKGFNIRTAEVNYSLSKATSFKAKELIITNY